MSEPPVPRSDGEAPFSPLLVAAVVVMVTLVQALVTMMAVIPASIAPKLAEAFDVRASMIGFQVTCVYVGGMSMSFVAGVFVRRYGAVAVSLAALGFVVLGGLVATLPHIAGLAVGSVLVGFGYGLTNPAASHLLMRTAREGQRNLLFSIKQAGQPLGGVIAGLMAPPLAVAVGWQVSLAAGAALALVLAVSIAPLRRRLDDDRDPNVRLAARPLQDVELVWRYLPLRLFAIAALCFAGVQLSLTTFAVTMLVEEIAFDLVAAGVVLAALQVAGVAGRVFWGLVADKVRDGNLTLIVIHVVSIVGALWTATLAPESLRPAVYGALVLFGMSAVGWNGVFMAEIARMAPAGRTGSATGGVLVPTFFGVMIGPPIYTAVFGLTGAYTTTFAWMTLGSLAGAALLLAARRDERRRAPAAAAE